MDIGRVGLQRPLAWSFSSERGAAELADADMDGNPGAASRAALIGDKVASGVPPGEASE